MVGAARIRRRLCLGAAALGLIAVGSAQAAKPTIYVNYTIGCTFTITDDSGKPVTAIPAGDYQILVRTPGSFGGVDLSGTYDMTACKGAVDFRLTGPGVSLATTLDDGDADSDFLYTTFMPSSTYTAVDGHQPTVARATFATTSTTLASSSGAATTPATTSTKTSTVVSPALAVSQLTGSVSAAGKLGLKLHGRAVSTLPHGRYVVTVTDGSSTAGFIVQPGGKAATTLTTLGYTGRKRISVTLTKGIWFFYARPGAKKTFFDVS